MRFHLRTLLIVLAIGPPMFAGGWWTRQKMIERYRQRQFDELIQLIHATIKPESWDDIGGQGSIDSFGCTISCTFEDSAPDADDEVQLEGP